MEQSSPTTGWSVNQPWRGLIGTAVVLAYVLVMTSLFDAQYFNGFYTLLIMAMVPVLVMVGMGWKAQYPPTLGLGQPWRGLLLVGFIVILGTLVAFGAKNFLANGVAQPFIILYLISTVITTFFLIIAFGMWPYNKLSAGLGGWLTLITAFVVTWVLFKLFNFSLLSFPSGTNPSLVAPVAFYGPGGPLAAFSGLAPHGPVPWELAIACWLWALAFLFMFINLGMWPLCKAPGLMRQPVFGFVLTASCLVLALIATYIGVVAFSMEPLMFMLLGVCWLFGVLVIMTMFQMWPGRLFKQPVWGVVNILLAAGLAALAYFAYRAFAIWHFGDAMHKYPIDIFTLATMMLGVTFPALAAYSDFFDFWPLPPTPAPPAQS